MGQLRASIDIGSNSIILLVAKITDDNKLEEIENIATVTALGKNLDKLGHFDDDSKKDSYSALVNYASKIKSYNINSSDVIVTATEASRVAKDAPEFFSLIKEKLGFNVTIINSDGEAYYTALGVHLGTKNEEKGLDNKTIIDIGGASTEIINVKCDPFSLDRSISLPIGSVRATDYLLDKKFGLKFNQIEKNFDIRQYRNKNVICVAGNMTTLACMMMELKEYSPVINGKLLSCEQIKLFYEKIKIMEVSEIEARYPYIGKRATSIVGGTKVIITLIDLMEINSIEISVYGLRHGTLFEGRINERYTT